MASRPAMMVPARWLAQSWKRLGESVDHDEVIRQADAEGSLRPSYLFMCVMASGIATAGLLVNSPAVIIGAMLISPLMAPTMRLGLGIGTLDHLRVRDAALVLAIGAAVSVLTAAAIAGWSPIREITPEIASRTRPNLFDLLVAILSGLAGGYATIRGRGGAIVGVAIATALMPPMAVVGYGLATSEWSVARGAGLLFITNLVAIALSVTAVSTWYGFSRRRVRHAIVWQTALIFLVVLPLASPLLQSLRAIGDESAIAQSTRAAVAEVLGSRDSRVLGLQVSRRSPNRPLRIELTIATSHYTRQDDRRLREAVRNLVNGELELRITPIVEAKPGQAEMLESALARAEAASKRPLAAPVTRDPVDAVLDGFPIAAAGQEIDHAQHRVRVRIASTDFGLEACRSIQATIAARLPGWSVDVVPATQAIPELLFDPGSASLAPEAEARLETIAWALHAWRIRKVEVLGRASSEGRGNTRLALDRARAVAARLRESGFEAHAGVSLVTPGQAKEESELGKRHFRSAQVVAVSDGD